MMDTEPHLRRLDSGGIEANDAGRQALADAKLTIAFLASDYEALRAEARAAIGDVKVGPYTRDLAALWRVSEIVDAAISWEQEARDGSDPVIPLTEDERTRFLARHDDIASDECLDPLARRLVALPKWTPGSGILLITDDGRSIRLTEDNMWMTAREDVLPDLTDNQTLGYLLGLVQDACGDPCLHLVESAALPGFWRVKAGARFAHRYKRLVDGCLVFGVDCDIWPSVPRALVAALEAAP